MSEITDTPASIQVVHRVLRKKTANVQVMLSDDAQLHVSQEHDELVLSGRVRDFTSTPRHEGAFLVVMTRDNATVFCRDIAERLGLTIVENT